MAAVRRVNEGESPHAVARDLDVNAPLLWRWRKKVTQQGESALKGIGRPKGAKVSAEATEASYQRRIAELERLVGRALVNKVVLESRSFRTLKASLKHRVELIESRVNSTIRCSPLSIFER